MRTPRALLLLLGSAALVIAAAQGVTGLSDLAFYGGPLLVVLGVLLSGRFIGERVILARRRAARGRLRPARVRWSVVRERLLVSLLERSTRLLRGPPARSCAA
jgi:hypothetical protein